MALKLIFTLMILVGMGAQAHLPLEVSESLVKDSMPTHCYHWIRTRPVNLLAQKVEFARSYGGAFFHLDRKWTYGNGIYCAYSLLDSIEYGERVIRLNLDEIHAEQVELVNPERHWYLLKTTESLKDLSGQPMKIQTESGVSFVIKTPQVIDSWTANDFMLRKDIEDTIRWLDQHPQYPDQLKLRNKLFYLLKEMQIEAKKQGELLFYPKK